MKRRIKQTNQPNVPQEASWEGSSWWHHEEEAGFCGTPLQVGAWTSASASSVNSRAENEKEQIAPFLLWQDWAVPTGHCVPGFLRCCPTEMPPCQMSLLHCSHFSPPPLSPGCSWPAIRTSSQNPQAAGFNLYYGRARGGGKGSMKSTSITGGGKHRRSKSLGQMPGQQPSQPWKILPQDITEESAQMWMLLASSWVIVGDFLFSSLYALMCFPIYFLISIVNSLKKYSIQCGCIY